MHWYFDVIKNYVGFSGPGDANRILDVLYSLTFFITIIAELIDKLILNGLLVFSTLYNLAVLIPTFAVGARRLHDIGKRVGGS
ncbi:hypothetical protein NBRC111894_4372 [Sporolactobacillus inulinus]|uniref:Uncharacterized protein n=1 Tax=Sporolactobacillus inulinus TaxID=2078 RepID=A0A4Y1ZK08_9BACL|nr:DUF805 domain-containing protein [Sporolactobacillus inulinus]GAY78818.1 hypothetical protein NBRC111894_4372 [Sporolactobacillus inulinus]